MDYKDLRSIQETYNAMFSEETINEGAGLVTGTAKAINKVLKPAGQTPEQGKAAVSRITRGLDTVAKPVKSAVKAVVGVGDEKNRQMMQQRRPTAAQAERMNRMEDVDVFDLVKEHLIGEGLTEEEAIAKMVNMSQEEMQSIIEG